MTLFGTSSQEGSTDLFELEAEQAILVRNIKIKVKVKKLISEALIMISFESKGLEFNNILVYNFSPIANLIDEEIYNKWQHIMDLTLSKIMIVP